MTAIYDRPEVGFLKSYLQEISDGLFDEWSYDGELLRFNWHGIRRVWKNTGKSRFTDGVEYIVMRWPD